MTPQTDSKKCNLPDDARECCAHLARLDWDYIAFARVARIKTRAAREMVEGIRPVPETVMKWLREMHTAADNLPPPPGHSDE
jgi:hypothetical protein